MLSDAGLEVSGPGGRCDGLDLSSTGLVHSTIVSRDGVIVAISGVTPEGIGKGSPDTAVLDTYGADIRQRTQEFTNRLIPFEAGDYVGTYFEWFEIGTNRVDTMWNGDPGRVATDCLDE